MLRQGAVPARAGHGGGVTLLVTGVLLSMSAAVVAAALYVVLSGRQALSDRLDREIAFRAAEVALLDAEADVFGAASGAARGERLDHWPAPGRCGEGPQRGLCVPGPRVGKVTAASMYPIWQPWLDRTRPEDRIGVTLGTFTGATLPVMPAGVAGPTVLPRYVVELLPRHASGERIDAPMAMPRPRLRITAMGQGRDPSVRVVLQTIVQP